ncbi:MAG: hypothetical protein D6744_03325 [Planctomycetota bacterium]|nr:MAG: hypothetical protein D6744_03325 [Planctomycetota bacterium]
MKKKDVEIGATYVAKVSGKLARVRIERESPYGGWDAKNVETGRRVRIKSAQRLRYPARPHGSRPGAPRSALTLEESSALQRKRDEMVVVIPSAAQRQADAEAGTPGRTELVGTTPLNDLPPGEAVDPAYDPDVCATVGCDRPAALTYLGRPRCQECYEDEVAYNDLPDGQAGQTSDETPNHEETTMAKAKKTTNTTKRTKAAKPAGDGKQKRISALDAAAMVLKKARKPMRTRELIDAMAEQGLWESPGGKTPHTMLHAAITREIGSKGDEARFRKVGRGQFEFAG